MEKGLVHIGTGIKPLSSMQGKVPNTYKWIILSFGKKIWSGPVIFKNAVQGLIEKV